MIQLRNNVIIVAGSVVTKDIPDNSICAGVPIRAIGDYYSFVDRRGKEDLLLANVQYKDANIRHIWEAFYKDPKKKNGKGIKYENSNI